MKICLCLIICLISFYSSFSQSLVMYNFDYSKYPQISANFTAADSNGKPIVNLTTDDFQVEENGGTRKIISVECPPPIPTKALSSVLVLDVSGSMSGKRVDMTANAALIWINHLDFSKSECAITVFDHNFGILADFSQSQQFLQSRIYTLTANKFGWTDYNKAMFGSLDVIKYRSNKKVIVFLSDGVPTNEPLTDDIIKMANQNNVTIHCISFFLRAPDCMRKFASQTGGMLFDNISDANKLNAAFKEILDYEQGSHECTITWESEPFCGNINTVVTLFKNNTKFSLNYQTPPGLLPKVNTLDNIVDFKNILINNPVYANNMMTAQNGDIEVLSITSDNPDFSCSPSKFNLAKNESKNLLISYTAQDSGYSVARFTVKTNFCDFAFFAKAGNPYYIPPKPKLRITHPNGFEKFVVGFDTVITWEGVAPTDTVSLEYSIDAGDSWKKITDSATGLIQPWKNIPNTPSDQCLMKVKFKDYEIDNFSLKSTAKVPFGFFSDFASKSDLTIEAWVYYTGNSISVIKNNFEILRKAKGEIWIKGYFNEFLLPISVVLDTNTWYHVALIVDRSQALPTEIFYLNGNKIIEVNNKIYTFSLDGNDNITVGPGYIDEFRMWTSHRLTSEIMDNMNNSLILPQDRLMLYYDFDQQVNKAVDLSGFQHDGTGNIVKEKFSPFKKTMPTQSDESDNLWSIVRSNLQSKDIDMGFCEFGKSKDSTISAFLRNKGSYPIMIDNIDFGGNDPDDFALVSGFNPIELKEFDSAEVEFRFNPTAKGNRDAVINIYTNEKIYTQNIKGYSDKAYIELTADLIDFGQVKIGSFKDSTIETTIVNNSTIPINITKTYQSFPNDKDFYTINGGGNFSLQPGETRQMVLRFKPSFLGRTSGSLAFEFDAPGSPVNMQLLGEGIVKNAAISADNLNFQTLVCDKDKIDSIYIRNIGIDNLIINDYNIDNNDFVVVNQLKNISIVPDSYYIAQIKYQPAKSGSSNGTLRIFSNSFPDSVFDIQLSGIKDKIDYQVSSKTINLGYLCPSEIKKFSIDLSNTGTVTNKFLINLPNSITSDYQSENIDPNNMKTINFEYVAANIEQTFSDTIGIVDLTCKQSTIININGITQNPKITSEDITIISVFGNSNTGTIVLVNNSDRDLTINNYPIITGNELAFDNLQLPLTIKAHESKNITVKYTPKDEINDQFKITYNFDPCSQSFTGTVFGNTTISSAMISIGNYEAKAGETVDVMLNVSNPVNFEKSGISKIKANISFNSTLLIPVSVDKGNVTKFVRNLDVDIPIVGNNPQSVDLKCIAGLGNDSNTVIKINDVTFEGGYAQINTKDGLFKLNGICNDGGARLLNPNSKTQIIAINPTPTESILSLKYELRESDNTIIELVSSTGESIKLLNQMMQKGTYQNEFDISELSSGIYFLILRTANDLQTRKVIICN